MTEINQIVDRHGRATTLYAGMKDIGHGLVNLQITRTFSAASNQTPRVVLDLSLPRESIDLLRSVL